MRARTGKVRALSAVCLAICLALSGCGQDRTVGDAVQGSHENQEQSDSSAAWEKAEEREQKDSGIQGQEDSGGEKKAGGSASPATSDTPDRDKKKVSDAEPRDDSSEKPVPKRSVCPSGQPGKKYAEISDGKDNHQDRYQTDPVPEGQKKPVEPQEVTVDKKAAGTCSLAIECSTVLDNMDKLKKGKASIVPEDGIIYRSADVVFYEGESVSDVLKRETRSHAVHLEFSETPGFNSDFIEGIGNLYYLDCGPLSGWSYCVNAWFPNYGCSRYIVEQGDQIEWHYTCRMGEDIGPGTGLR